MYLSALLSLSFHLVKKKAKLRKVVFADGPAIVKRGDQLLKRVAIQLFENGFALAFFIFVLFDGGK